MPPGIVDPVGLEGSGAGASSNAPAATSGTPSGIIDPVGVMGESAPAKTSTPAMPTITAPPAGINDPVGLKEETPAPTFTAPKENSLESALSAIKPVDTSKMYSQFSVPDTAETQSTPSIAKGQKPTADNSIEGEAVNTVEGLPKAAATVGKDTAKYVYNQAAQIVLPGITTDEADDPNFLKKQLAPSVIPAVEKLGAQIIQHPIVSAAQVGQGTILGALDFMSNAMVNYIPGLVPNKEKASTIAALQSTFQKYLFPEGQGDIGKGYETAGQAAIPIVLSGGASAGAEALGGGSLAQFAAGTAGFATAGQLQLPSDATIKQRAQNAMDSLIQQGIFTAGSYAASIAKGMLVEGVKTAYKDGAATPIDTPTPHSVLDETASNITKHGEQVTHQGLMDNLGYSSDEADTVIRNAKGRQAAPPTSDAQITQQANTFVDKNLPDLTQKYLAKHGNVVGADEAKEFVPGYSDERSTSDLVQKAASKISDSAYNELLNTKQGEGNNTVLITAGGTGAGKSTSIADLDTSQYPVVFDTNLSNAQGGIDRIQKAIDKGYNVDLRFTYTRPDKAYDRVLDRAEQLRQKEGSGRPVSAQGHLDMHYGSQDSLPEIMEHFKTEIADGTVGVKLYDNSGMAPVEVKDPLDFINKIRDNRNNETDYHTQLNEQRKLAHGEGRISDKTNRGFERAETLRPRKEGQGISSGISERSKDSSSNEVIPGNAKTLGKTTNGDILQVPNSKDFYLEKDNGEASKITLEEKAPAAKEETPEQKPSKIGKSIEAKAVEAGIADKLEGTAGYNAKTFKGEAEKVATFINEDYGNARATLRGETPLPEGMSGVAFISGMEERLKADPDPQLAHELANSPLVSATSVHAQETSLARMREQDSFTQRANDVRKAREAAAEKKNGKTAKSDTVKEIKKATPKVTKQTWSDFLDEIKCNY